MNNLYFNAAQAIAKDYNTYLYSNSPGFCCNAIKYEVYPNWPYICDNDRYPLVKEVLKFAEYFKPEELSLTEAWWDGPREDNAEEVFNQRVIALLFMHWIINDKDQERYNGKTESYSNS
jgi:hypothetical protein